MPEKKLMLPIGIENFPELREEGFYYVDKTGMIKELLENLSKVTLFTRPRRFGKSLNMSMLRTFFEVGTDAALFDGLFISRETRLCEMHMGKYPVISISLKDVSGLDFASAKRRMWTAVADEADRHMELAGSGSLSEGDRLAYRNLVGKIGELEDALKTLSKLLYRHYGKKVILLIDEYDVPLNYAHLGGYYDEMVAMIRTIMSAALKTNEYLQFAVLTGCLRVSKESIFTGLNNLKVCSVLESQYDEWFGFTEDEVRDLLAYYDAGGYLDATREWYDGYRIGSIGVYCPWDVINWCDSIRVEAKPRPEDFWANSSGNDIITRFADMADQETREEMEILFSGGTVTKRVRRELTYREIYDSIDNVWTMLLNTGYLTCLERTEDGGCVLSIPNREISHLFRQMLDDWFYKKMQVREGGLSALFEAAEDGDAVVMEAEIKKCLAESISFMDGGNTPEAKETFYHGLLIGLFRGCRNWIIRSNREAGDGRADITVKNVAGAVGFIVEVKYADGTDQLNSRAQAALSQIDDRNYGDYFIMDAVDTVYKYGIAFYRKQVRVVTE